MLEVLLYTRRNQLIGSSRSFVGGNTAVLANIHVHDEFKFLGYGSHILQKTERSLNNIFQIRSMNLLAWQPSGGSEVIDFYKKNGYFLTDTPVEIFDNYSQLFDLIRMHNKV
jgi:GNAT superfamily N-acetyltransferase